MKYLVLPVRPSFWPMIIPFPARSAQNHRSLGRPRQGVTFSFCAVAIRTSKNCVNPQTSSKPRNSLFERASGMSAQASVSMSAGCETFGLRSRAWV